ncbi:MAG: hypothetical protein U0P45_01875 [Acidimicrobiales bacterium]
MPMMRRGPLDRYPVEWVIRQAGAHQATGSIEFHAGRPATFYFDAGRVYAAVDEADEAAELPADEVEARRTAVELLVRTLGEAAGDGWYYHDPLAHLPIRGSWSWDTATLLLETRTTAYERDALASWAERPVSLRETPTAAITLGADAWAVVVELAATAAAGELREQLGWSPARLVAALTEIEQLGVLDPAPAWRPTVVSSPPEAAAPAHRHSLLRRR